MTETGITTPRPWSFMRQSGPKELRLKRDHFVVGQHLGRGVAIVFSDGEPVDAGNADLIVRAVNTFEENQRRAQAFDAMRDALLSWSRVLEEQLQHSPDPRALRAFHDKAVAALELAGYPSIAAPRAES